LHALEHFLILTIHNLGFPRFGKHRELKFALEKYWSNATSQDALLQTADTLRKQHWQHQNKLDWVPVGDFSFYDQVLDMSFLLGNVPKRAKNLSDNELDNYFRVARGRASVNESDCTCIQAGEMTKWFDTNYHYIVPEFSQETNFALQAQNLIVQIRQAQEQGIKVKPVIIGPVTYLWLGKSKDNTNKLDLLDSLVKVYVQLFDELAKLEIEWIQLDEPVLVTELEPDWQTAFKKAYDTLANSPIKLLLASYFGSLQDNLNLACDLPIDGLHIDAVNAKDEVQLVINSLPNSFNSCNFCTAKLSHDLMSLSSSCSLSKSTGTCNNEQDGANHSLSCNCW
jgi:5-methyltetrahydropteroyltriglutamate--homocysteine methyltransferase